MKHRGIYPGSFDPVTLGHLDIIKRSARLMDELTIGVLKNSAKRALFSVEERVQMLEESVAGIPNVRVEAFDGLTVDFAKSRNAGIIVRGLRAVTDFEYELQIAQTNRKIDPVIDTLFLTTSVEYAYLSSSIVKEIASYNGDITQFVTPYVAQCIYNKIKAEHKEN